ncbi:MAG: SdrD B-like domain-containing protein, partial [Chitinophagales bacterium]
TEVGDNIPYAITPTEDDGFAIAGFSGAGTNLFQAILLTKTDEVGAAQWTKIFGGSNFEVGHDIIQTSDNGYLLGGRSMSFGTTSEDAFLLKTDDMGNIQWTRAFGGDGDDAANSVFQNSDGSYTFIGESNSFSTNNDRNDVFMVNTTSNGTLNWSKTHSTSLNIDRIAGVALPNGGYAFTGLVEYISAEKAQEEEDPESFNKNIIEQKVLSSQKTWLKGLGGGGTGLQMGVLFVETDADGEIVQEKMYGIPGTIDCFGTSIIPTDDGGFFIGGYTIEPTSTGFSFHITGMKITSTGTIQWVKNFQAFDSFFPVTCNQLDNGNLTLTSTNSLNAGVDSRINSYFMNEDGGLIETHQYGDSGLNASRDAIVNSNGILVAGQTNSFGGSPTFNSLDNYLIQTDGFGDSGCNDLLIIPQQADYTYSNLNIDFTTTTNGTSHTPTVQTENLSPETTVLCSFEPPVVGMVEGFVWWDRNKDGIQQANEGGLENVGVNLYNAADFTLVMNTFTESDGTYSLEITNTTLDYYITFGTAPLYIPTTPNVGSNASINSDITNNFETGSTDVFQIDADEIMDIDAGLLGTGTASGFVWKDDNADGVFAGETGAEGVSVLLVFNNDNFSNIPFTTTTQGDGSYSFDNLIVGEITLEIADIQGTIIDGGTLTTANNPTNPFNINMNQLSIEDVNFGFNVPICNIEVLSAMTSECDPDDNTYSLDVTIAYQNAPSGDIEVTVLGNVTAFTPDGSGQETFTINDLNANGFQNVGVSAGFANNAACNDNLGAIYNAPASCNVDCAIQITDVNVGDCNPSTNEYSIEVSVNYEGAPTGDIDIEVLGNTTSFAADGTGTQTFTIGELNANGFENVGVSASFANDADCNDHLGATYNAPDACDVVNCNIEVTDLNVGDCNPSTNQYSIEVSINYQGAPSGDIEVNIGGNTSTFTPDGSGQETFSVELVADGTENVEVTANFANDANCTGGSAMTFDAPEACNDTNCSIEVMGVSVSDCNPSNNSYSLEVKVEYSDAPDGILNIEILGTVFSFIPDGSGAETFNITLPTSETNEVNVTASFVANPNCSSTLANAYNEPTACTPQCDIEITNIEVGDCNEETNLYTLDITVVYSNSPGGGIVI